MAAKQEKTQDVSFEACLVRRVEDALECLMGGNTTVLNALTDSKSPGKIDDLERLTVLRMMEQMRVYIDSVFEVLRGGDAEALEGEFKRVGAEIPRILTQREMEVLPQVALGRSSKEISSSLSISLSTVETHRANIMRKLGFRHITDLVLYAVRNHMIEL